MTDRYEAFSLGLDTFYIAGPMRGYPNMNFDAFHRVARYLREEIGVKALNPAENFDGEQGVPYQVCMQEDLQMVLQSQALALLPGWEKSEGAKEEVRVASHTGKKFFLVHFDDDGTVSLEAVDKPYPYEGIADTAKRLVWGDRNQDYGPPTTDFTRTGRLWGALLDRDPIPPEMVAIMMAGLKLSRLAQTPGHLDSRVDTIGYMLTLDRVINDE